MSTTISKKLEDYEAFLKEQEKKSKADLKLYSDLRYVTRKPIHYFDIQDIVPTEGQLKRAKKKRGRKPKNKKK